MVHLLRNLWVLDALSRVLDITLLLKILAIKLILLLALYFLGDEILNDPL